MTLNRKPVVPSMNTLWFYFPQKTRRALHGTVPDVQRKFDVLSAKGLADQGMEMFLMPTRLADHPSFDQTFLDRFTRLPFRTVHIGETDPDFLDEPSTPKALDLLRETLLSLNSKAIVIHAHHFERNLDARAELLRTHLPGTTVLVENNGFDSTWGAQPKNVENILSRNPDFRFCLDITHVNDFKDLRVSSFTGGLLGERLREIHWACSTYLMDEDPYVDKGYPGYNPFHALFPLTDIHPSSSTIDLARKYPTVMEGVVPPEDQDCTLLHQERALILNGEA